MDRLRLPGFSCIIGLTGGVASGKSTACAVLASLGAVVVSSDALGHSVYTPGSPAHAAVVSAFGPGVLSPTGAIDRAALGGMVFGNPALRATLNSITWPAIAAALPAALAAGAVGRTPATPSGHVGVVEAALLCDAGWDSRVDEVWLCTASDEDVTARLGGRGLVGEAAAARLAATRSASAAAARVATVTIHTGGPRDETKAAIEREWRGLLGRIEADGR